MAKSKEPRRLSAMTIVIAPAPATAVSRLPNWQLRKRHSCRIIVEESLKLELSELSVALEDSSGVATTRMAMTAAIRMGAMAVPVPSKVNSGLSCQCRHPKGASRHLRCCRHRSQHLWGITRSSRDGGEASQQRFDQAASSALQPVCQPT